MKKYLVIFTVAVFLILPHSYVKAATLPDDKEIADIVLSLVQYIKWKDRNYNVINFCTIGLDTVGDIVHRKGNENFNVIKNPKDTSLPACHVLYVSASEAKHADEMLWKVKDLPVVPISLIKGFAKMGGIIELVVEVNKLSFKINVTSAKKANVIIKSDLLGIANIISSE